MTRHRASMLAIAVCLLLAVGGQAQTRKPEGLRSIDAGATIAHPVDPDSPGASMAVAAGPEANGAGQQTAVPRLMKFSGALHDATGKPVTGAVDVTFSLYSTEAGGDSLWFETQSVQADELGRYTALLGAMHTDGLPVDLFTSGEVRWLGIQVGAEAEQQPRVLLVSVPYALKAGDAETLGGKPASAYVLADAQNGTATGTATTSTSGATPAGTKGTTAKSSKTNVSPLVAVCSTITSNVGGTANFLPMFTAQCNIENSVITQSGGNVGVGTAAPGAQLDVQNPTTQNNIALRATNANGTMMFIPNLSAGAYNGLVQTGDQGLIFYGTAPGAGNFVLGPWGSGGMRMTNTGKVGIGTATPAAMLDVNGTAQFDNAVTIATAQSLSGPELDVQTPAFANTISLRATNANGTMMLIPNLGAGAYNGLVQAGDQGLIFYGTAPNAGNFVIGPWSGGGSPGIRMTAAGNVGIGTTAPAAMLDVNGTANFSGLVTFAPGQNFGSSTSMVTGSTGTFTGSTANQVLSATQSGAGAAAVLNNTTGGNILVGQNNGTQKFAVDGSGSVTLTGDLNLAQTTSQSVGVINLGGSPFIHAFGTQNTFVGTNAGNFTTTGSNNTASGQGALSSNTTGGGNTASGSGALYSNTTGSSNTACGGTALIANTTGNYNTASGLGALNQNTTGSHNTASGDEALLSNTTGNNNTASGDEALFSNTTGNNNTALGDGAGETLNPANTSVTGAGDTFIGYESGPGTSAQLNNATAIGANALVSESNALVLGSINGVNGATSSVKVGIGTATPAHILDVVGDINASGNIASAGTFSGNGSGLTGITSTGLSCSGCVGNSQLGINYAASSSQGGAANNALALGGMPPSAFQPAGNYATTGSNTFTQPQAVSTSAGAALNVTTNDATTGAAVFSNANLSGDAITITDPGTPIMHITATGNLMTNGTLQASNFTASNSNTFAGVSAGNSTTTGTDNIAIGRVSLQANTGGTANSALGALALSFNTTGGSNSAVGYSALFHNTTGYGNTAIGDGALVNNCNGFPSGCNANNNTAVGFNAGTTSSPSDANTIGANNTFIGYNSGPGTTTPINNATAIGENALVSASNAMALGGTGADAVSVGIGTQTPAVTLQVVGDIRIGTGGTNGCVQNFSGAPLSGSCSSDGRLKTDIQPFSTLLDKVAQLQPVHYHWRVSEHPEYHFGSALISGLIAQDVEKLFPELVSEDSRGFKTVNYSELPFLLLQSVRELKAENDELREQIKAQEARTRLPKEDEAVAQLRREVEELRALVTKSADAGHPTQGTGK